MNTNVSIRLNKHSKVYGAPILDGVLLGFEDTRGEHFATLSCYDERLGLELYRTLGRELQRIWPNIFRDEAIRASTSGDTQADPAADTVSREDASYSEG